MSGGHCKETPTCARDIDMGKIGDQDKQELVERAIELARHRFVVENFNCAESTFWGITQALNLPVDEAVLRAVTPLGGGFGDARATCGALVAAAMALGVELGRTELDTPRKLVAYDRTRALYERFLAEAGSDTCRVLNELGFERPDLYPYCARFVTLAVRLAVDILLTGDAEADREAYARSFGTAV